MEHRDWPERREPLLDRVYARGNELRRRRQMAIGVIAAALVVLIAVPAVALTGSGGSHKKVNTIGAPTTSMETVPETTAVPDATTTTAPTTTLSTSTTTTALVCRNSTNPRCGPFRWDPQPVNKPASAHVTFSPTNPTVGEDIGFALVGDDPDAPELIFTPDMGDFPTYGHGDIWTGPPNATPYGPWTPPIPKAGHQEYVYHYSYRSPGTYTATFKLQSSVSLPPGVDLPDPYGSETSVSVTVVVGPASTTTTTTAG